MAEQQQQNRRDFASLHWYGEAVSFLFTFAAITSEVLLGAGLTVSTANFLTDGKVMGDNTTLANAWAWAQALAIDSGLGVTFASVFISIKQRDWIKVCCYCLLTMILAVVAGAITDIDTLSHALHITTSNAITQVGFNVNVLTTCRAIAVVGFVLMSRLKETSFKELYEATPPRVSPPLQATKVLEETESTIALIRKLIAEALTQEGRGALPEEQKTVPPSMMQDREEPSQPQTGATTAQPDQEGEETQEEQQDDHPQEREARLEHAYQELEAEGKRISGRALAARAHVRRSTCNQWLAVYHPESVDEEE